MPEEVVACSIESEEQVTEESSLDTSANDESAQSVDAQLDPEMLPGAIEALLFVWGGPMTPKRLAQLVHYSEQEVTDAANELKVRLQESCSGIELVEVAEGYQLRTVGQYSQVIKNLKATKPKKLSHAALETLAIIAYRQPIVKSDIEAIRGVDATPTLKTLVDRKLVRIIGHQATVGQPALYGTTPAFLEIFGLKSLSELPSIRDLKAFSEDPGETEYEEQNEDDPKVAGAGAEAAQ